MIGSAGPSRQSVSAELGDIPIHVLGGSIVPMQAYRDTTDEVKLAPLTVLVAFTGGQDQTAEGYYYSDIDEKLNIFSDFHISKFEASFENNKGVISMKTHRPSEIVIEEIVLRGLSCTIDKALSGDRLLKVEQSGDGGIRLLGLKKTINEGPVASWSCISESGSGKETAIV